MGKNILLKVPLQLRMYIFHLLIHFHLGAEAHFINLSNGCESLPYLAERGGLDPTLLMCLAQGVTCYIHDYGSRNKKRKAPRAVWYGVTFIRYALHRLWQLPGEPSRPMLRGHNVAADFDRAIHNLDPAVKKRIRYYSSYVSPKLRTGDDGDGAGVRLLGAVGATEIDGQREVHASLARRFYRHSGLVRSAAGGGSGTAAAAAGADAAPPGRGMGDGGSAAKTVAAAPEWFEECGLTVFDTEVGFDLSQVDSAGGASDAVAG